MVAEGYKESEIGVIPEEWEVVKLKELCNTTTGKLNANAMVENGKYKFFTCAKEPYLINEYKFDTEALLISGNGANVGYIHYYDGKFNAYQRTYVLDKFTSNIQLVKYTLQKLLKIRIDKEKNAGNTPYITLDTITDMKIPLPPLKEQEKISDILSTADEKIDAIEGQIQKAETLKKGLLQKLLSEGIGHSEFKDSELGKIPEGWEVVELKSIIKDLIGGVSVNSEDRIKLKDEYGILKTSSIQNGSFLPNKHKTILNTEISRATTNPLADHIIFSRMNTPDLVGQSGYVEETINDLFLPDRLWQLNVKDRDTVFVKWLSFILVSRDTFNTIKKSATGTSNSMKNISKPSLLKIKISLPPVQEQKQIADILSTADEKIEILRSKKEKYETLKKGLLQKLLSGEVRV